MRIHDNLNTAPMTHVQERIYRLQILWSDGTSYDWGYWLPNVDPTPTLIVRTPQFSQQAQLTYRYITVEVTRPTGTQITIDYEDDLTQTNWVNVTISERGGSQVHSDTTTNDSHVFNWGAANSSLDYLVYVEISHQFFGEMSFFQYMDAEPSFASTPNIEALGTFGGIQTGNLLAFCFSLIFFGGFSYEFGSNAGVLAGVSILTIMTYLGFANYTYNFLAFSWFFATILLLTGGRK